MLTRGAAAGVAPLLDEAAQLPAASAYASDALTVPPSLAGLPAISIPGVCDPCTGEPVPRPSRRLAHGARRAGLPIGLQLISARGRESAYPAHQLCSLCSPALGPGLLLQCAVELERALSLTE